jgi:aspartyl-tRNA(Asn)/glutamyl-tRNA(Gln) amidotransferase subunit A
MKPNSIRQHPAFSHLEACISATNAPRGAHTMLRVDADDARLQLTHNLNSGRSLSMPLLGLTVSVKDLFDVAGQVTHAGAVCLDKAAPATTDAPALARLKQAGAVSIGRTNMTEFAFSGIGINHHYGTPANPADTAIARVPGGSSSGAAVSVGLGMADIGLGSDTGGSLRIPAALCGLVGFKSTQGAVPLAGAYPLSQSLDSVGAITRSVDTAIAAHQVMSHRPVAHWAKPLSHLTLGIATTVHLDDLDPTVGQAWARTLSRLVRAGVTLVEMPLPALSAIGDCQSVAPLVAIEAHAWHRDRLMDDTALLDPRVKARMQTGQVATAADYLAILRARQTLQQAVLAAVAGVDAMIAPTVPMVAPPIDSIAPGTERDAAYLTVNRLLLRNPSTVNFLNGCAISIPCQAPDELPVGLMIWQTCGRDDTVLGIAKQLTDNGVLKVD